MFARGSGRPATGGPLESLVGARVPGIELQQAQGSWTSLKELAARRSLVVFFYSGADPRKGPNRKEQARQDRERAAAWAHVEDDLLAAGYELVAVSAQTPIVQAAFATREELPFRFLSDPDLDLARELAVPTQGISYAPFYEPFTLVVRDRKIALAVYPVHAHEVQQVCAWIRAR